MTSVKRDVAAVGISVLKPCRIIGNGAITKSQVATSRIRATHTEPRAEADDLQSSKGRACGAAVSAAERDARRITAATPNCFALVVNKRQILYPMRRDARRFPWGNVVQRDRGGGICLQII